MSLERAAPVPMPSPATVARRGDRVFYAGMSATILVILFVGFARTYFLRGYFFPRPLPVLFHIHGLVFTSWIVLFGVQSVLVAAQRISVHRRLGMAGAALAVLLVAVGLTTAIVSARQNFAAGNPGALSVLATPVGDMLVFAILTAAGMHYRRRPQAHKRLMLLATISILGAAFARWPLALMAAGPIAFFGATDLLIAAAALYDLAWQRRLHPATAWGGLLIVVSQPLRLAIGRTDAWLAIAKAIVGR